MTTDQAARLAMLTNHELLEMPYALLVELKRRCIIRTADLVGGVGEHLAWRMYGGVLASNGNKAYDLTDPGDRLIQVKARVASRGEGSLKIGLRSTDGFDACLVLLLDPQTLRPLMAREVSQEGVLGMKARKRSLFISDFRAAGIDVLDRASYAWEAVGRDG
ncbi:DUF6998 domain-containing protein [Pseudarthrobacter cellobiosi]|uniref:DUF6998 domain-containing protein n=1 Tax=Pseudarthrobacter cellobiosi TaxID=2953654 RepID=UPI00208F6FC8|nr:hypothetical protein [Pseudarthrobacter sp. HLT1-5]MCO4254531.1 hypothetical protein [Pseudarthrobacter sp. HLT1-5]